MIPDVNIDNNLPCKIYAKAITIKATLGGQQAEISFLTSKIDLPFIGLAVIYPIQYAQVNKC